MRFQVDMNFGETLLTHYNSLGTDKKTRTLSESVESDWGDNAMYKQFTYSPYFPPY